MKEFDTVTSYRPFNNDSDVLDAIKGRFDELINNVDGQGQCYLRLLLEDNDFTIEINVIRILEVASFLDVCIEPEDTLKWTGLSNLSEIIELVENLLFDLTKKRPSVYELSENSVFWKSNDYGVLINRGEPATFPTTVQ